MFFTLGARYYDPKRSFWLSVDPLSEITNTPYAYVWNYPVNFADPTGLRGERVGGPGETLIEQVTIIITKSKGWWNKHIATPFNRNISQPIGNF